MAIVRCTDDNPRLVEIHQRIKRLCFRLADDVEFKADVFRAALEIPEPLFFDPAEPLANTAALMEDRFIPGFGGQDFVVELDRVVVDLRDRVIADEI